jgi:hypothetical protein
MGLVNSIHDSVNTDIKKMLMECGFVDSKGEVGGLPKEILETVDGFGRATLESFELKLKAKVAVDESISGVKLSTYANIRTIQIVLCFWKDKFPGQPIPTAVKKQMHRLACLVISYLFL